MAGYARAARRLREISGLRRVRTSLLATYTIDGLVPYLEVEAARHGLALDIYRGPFNTVRQELLSPTSGCLVHRPDVVFAAQSLEDVCPALMRDYLTLQDYEVEGHIDLVVAETVSAVSSFRAQSNAAVVLHNFALPQGPALGVYEPMAHCSQTDAIRTLNARLAEELTLIPGVYVLDFDHLCAGIGYANWRDEKMWHLGRAPLSVAAMGELARLQADYLRIITCGSRKCLVLDLDNTLWGGVAGEEGVSGIQVGHTYPGSVFREFQQFVLEFYHRGVILAINSKNNPADVQEVFASHPDMLLKREHFASVRVNWQPKPDNMVRIAKELGIGLETMVFFDDHPVERAMMRSVLPQVLTLEVPADPLGYIRVLRECRAFDKLSITQEDRRRGAMYRERAERVKLEAAAPSLSAFLEGLNMKIQVSPVDEFALPRVLDLIHKTNQFNLTTRRHSPAELARMLGDPDYGAFSLRLRDRFGDSGIVAAAIVKVRGTVAHIDTFLLSCRVIGRSVETAFLAYLADWSRNRGLEHLEGEFIPTLKNSPAADFFERHGFARTASSIHSQASAVSWRLNLSETTVEWPSYIQRRIDARACA